jgi:2-amino-4-ketopentanoate thiolase alpha subunit
VEGSLTSPERERVPAGSWVEVRQIVLPAGERAPSVPPDTAAVDFEARIRGFLLADAALGADATVRTLAGREVTGRLTDVEPRNPADFGDPVPDLLRLGLEARRVLEGHVER